MRTGSWCGGGAVFVCIVTSMATIAYMYAVLFSSTTMDGAYGTVVASLNASSAYGFGARRTLVVLNLTAYRTADTSSVAERGLNGVGDIHPFHKRYARMSMYRDGVAVDGVVDAPVAVDQKGGDRPQIHLGIEFRDPDDVREDAKAELLTSLSTDLEDYFLRGCYFEPSCARDFVPTVLDVTPQMKGELVEVLFWQDGGVGYTYEGVYGLFAKMKRKFYQASVPWESKGKIDKDAPCADALSDIAIVFNGEKERVGRGEYNAFERIVQADMVYPSSSNEAYVDAWRSGCADRYTHLVDYYLLPNLRNASAVPLNLTTFVQMYMASRLVQQVDFGFRGAQQYYYKSPGSLDLATGPPYDFDAPWDICGVDRDTVDVVTCHGQEVSPLWARLGRDAAFLQIWQTDGLHILDRDVAAVRTLYAERRALYAAGYFERHEARWRTPGRASGDVMNRLVALARERVVGGASRRGGMDDELKFQLEWYEDRYARLRRNVAEAKDGFIVRITWGPIAVRVVQLFWWVVVFGVGPAFFVVLFCWCWRPFTTRNRTPVD